MKNYRQILKVLLTSIFVILAFVGCNNTSDVDGVYDKYYFDFGLSTYVETLEFKSGKFKSTDKMSTSEGTFKITDEDVIEIQFENVSGSITRTKLKLEKINGKVIQMKEEGYTKGGSLYIKKE